MIDYCERARRVFVVQWEAICLRRGWYGFNTAVGAAGDEDGFDIVAFGC